MRQCARPEHGAGTTSSTPYPHHIIGVAFMSLARIFIGFRSFSCFSCVFVWEHSYFRSILRYILSQYMTRTVSVWLCGKARGLSSRFEGPWSAGGTRRQTNVEGSSRRCEERRRAQIISQVLAVMALLSILQQQRRQERRASVRLLTRLLSLAPAAVAACALASTRAPSCALGA